MGVGEETKTKWHVRRLLLLVEGSSFFIFYFQETESNKP